MVKESPFLLFKVECPICKTINEFEMVRVGAYTEDGRDTDFCPMNIKWRFPAYESYNPLVYFAGTCSNCYYTRELNNNFRDWKSDNNFRTYRLKQVKEKHLEQLAVADSVLKRMGDAIDVKQHPNESAILKLHLAVYDERLADHHRALELGRLYLRIGWVFRGLQESEQPQRAQLSGFMEELDNKYGMLSHTLDTVETEIDIFEQFITSVINSEQKPLVQQSQLKEYGPGYEERMGALRNGAGEARTRLSELGRLIEEHKIAVLGANTASTGPRFGSHTSFREFLIHLKEVWPGIVVDEREAIEKAVENYKLAFESGRDIAQGTQQIQATYLIAELSRRIGKHDDAKQYFNTTIKSGQDFIYRNRKDQSRTVLARKILELAIEQGRSNLAAAKT